MLSNEIRTGKNVKQLIIRASQFSRSDPQGPSYLIVSRETLEEQLQPYEVSPRKWKPLAPKGLAPASIEEIGQAFLKAKAPVIITTYLGRNSAAMPELVKLCEKTGTAVLVGSSSHIQSEIDLADLRAF